MDEAAPFFLVGPTEINRRQAGRSAHAGELSDDKTRSLPIERGGRRYVWDDGKTLGLQLVGSSGSGPDTALNLYKLFRDPHSAFDIGSRQYSFMTIGPVSPLSFSGSPLFFNAFNAVEEFLTANGLNQ